MTPIVHVDREAGLEAPDDESFSRWVAVALTADQTVLPEHPEISIRISGLAEMTTLNERYRNKTGPTNVLSFPTDLPSEIDRGLLGDIVICAPIVEREAAEQNKASMSHWAHMTVHGTLHLMGFDHVEDHEAEQMESLETRLLAAMGYPDPYQTYHSYHHMMDSEHT